jgi:hypothetical protein
MDVTNRRRKDKNPVSSMSFFKLLYLDTDGIGLGGGKLLVIQFNTF